MFIVEQVWYIKSRVFRCEACFSFEKTKTAFAIAKNIHMLILDVFLIIVIMLCLFACL